MVRVGEHAGDGALLHDAAGVHDAEPVCALRDDPQIVRNERQRQTGAALQSTR
jgi:hypothetical protein